MKYISEPSNKIKFWLVLIISELRNHVIALIILAFVYGMLWLFPQTKDLLLILNQPTNHIKEVLLLFISLMVLALLISNLNDYLRNNESSGHIPMDSRERAIHFNNEFNEDQKEYIARMLPKVLGTLLILITAFSVSSTFYEITGRHIIIRAEYGLLITTLLLILSLNQKIAYAVSKFLIGKSKNQNIALIIALLCLITIPILGLFNTGGSDDDIVRLFWAFMLLATFYFLISFSYSKAILNFKNKIGVYIVGTITFIAFITYFIFLFNPGFASKINPLTVVFTSLIGLFTLAKSIAYLGKLTNVPLLQIVILLFIIWGSFSAKNENFTHYEVSTVPTKFNVNDRMELKDYVRQWIKDRKLEIDSATVDDKFPVIFVSSEGGGSRAGLWSLLVNGYLYDRNPEYFKTYLFSITGASGGGVGNGIFYNTIHNLKSNNFKFTSSSENDHFKYSGSRFYSGNYLSSSLAALMGRDLFKSITNVFVFPDRAKLLEEEWENNYLRTFNGSEPLNRPFISLCPSVNSNEKIAPLILFNTTHLQSGLFSVVSPVKFKKERRNLGVFKDFLDDYYTKRSDTLGIKISTAMLLNARFPYISPVGRVKGVGQFADAGYYDNIGGTTTKRLVNTFNEVLKTEFDSISDKIDIRHLIITNNDRDNTGNCSTKEKRDKIIYSTQLTAPLNVILEATFAHPKEMEKTFGDSFLVQSKRTKIPVQLRNDDIRQYFINKDDSITPIIPLGRYMSEAAILSLEKRLECPEVTDKLNRLID